MENKQMDKPFITALAICKNEGESTRRWVENVRKFADSIVIVDTGSTDDSVEIAHDAGATVVFKPISESEFSFADARNIALKYVPQETNWLVFTDIDEIIEEDSIPNMLEAIEWIDYQTKPEECNAIQVVLRNRNDDGSIKTVSKNVNPRIIRIDNIENYWFEGELHEQLIRKPIGGANQIKMFVPREPIYIDHYGYTKEALERTGKSKMRVALAERAVEQHPESLRCIEQYACALAIDGQFEAADKIRTDAKRQLLNEIDKDRELSAQMLRNMMVGRFIGKEDYNGFIALYVMAINLLPEYPDFDYLYGCLCDQDEMGSAAHALLVAADQKFNKLGNIIGETAYNPDNAMRIIKKWSEKKNE